MADVKELLRLAIEHHQQGRLDEAEVLYRQILDADPNHADANHMLGVAACQRGALVDVVAWNGAGQVRDRYP